MKKQSINQSVWRAEVHRRNGTIPKWKWLEPTQVADMIDVRKRGNTYASIAEHFGVTIEAVRKRCLSAGLPGGHADAIDNPMYGVKIKTWEGLGFQSPARFFRHRK